jgi:hypothetical protein
MLLVVVDAVLADDAAIEVAQQREIDAELLGERVVGAVTLDADPEDAGAKLADSIGLVPKLGQLDRSDPPEVEQVPGQHDRPLLQLLAQGEVLAGVGTQGEVRGLVAYVEVGHVGYLPSAG